MKTCKTCLRDKPASEFYFAPNNRDGLFGECKTCYRARVKENRQRNAAHYQAYEAGRLDKPERKALRMRVRKARRANPVKHADDNATKHEWNSRNPAKRAALIATSNAIRDGKLTRPDACERCGEACKPVAHHSDFAKPLDVLWICTTCHGQLMRRVLIAATAGATASP
jgi:hypothetical protein